MRFIATLYVAVPIVAASWLGVDWYANRSTVQILNVSYDPTRELWRKLNQAFVESTGQNIRIRQSHGGSSSQARSVIDGLHADVVSLAFWTDTDEIRRAGLLDENWQSRLPNDSIAFYSTVVFVVRSGNPKQIRDWPDLVRPGVQVVTPNPKTSGNGKLSFLAAWGSVISRGGSESDAIDFTTRLYRNVPVMDTGARGSTTTFAQNAIGDAQLTWENEAHQEVRESAGRLEIVYPPISIRAEPPIAMVDAVVDRNGTRAVAEEYTRFVFSDLGQEIIARNGLRPISSIIEERHRDRFPRIELFPITAIAVDWRSAQERFFETGGEFDQVYLK